MPRKCSGTAAFSLVKPFDVGLVEDRLVPRHALAARFAVPVEVLIDDDAFRHERRRVALVEGKIVAGLDLIAEHGRVPLEFERVGAGVGVEQQLVGIEAVARLRLVGAMHPVAIECSGMHIRQIAVKHLVGIFGQFDAGRFGLSRGIEEADFDLRGVRGEQREIAPVTVPVHTARIG